MKRLWSYLEQVGFGALVGGLLGVLAGAMEYCWLFAGGTYPGDLVQAYNDITVSYMVVGSLGGILVAVGIRLVWGKPQAFTQQLVRLWVMLSALGVFFYLAVWATYRLGLPLLKLTNLLAYGAAVGVAALSGVLLYQAVRPILRWGEHKSEGEGRLKGGAALVLALGIAGVLVIPPLYLGKPSLVQEVALTDLKGEALHKRPNVVFILIDTLRADHLPMYGYSRQTAPHLSAFAQRGMTFTNMYAPSSHTRPSVATLFSALYPTAHKTNQNRDFLSGSIVTLAEVLHGTGYQTFAVSANANVSPTFGYAQGFDEFIIREIESPIRLTMLGAMVEDTFGEDAFRLLLLEDNEEDIVPNAEVITNITLRWASESRKEPCFLYVHYIDPHAPYSPPVPFDRVFDYRSNPPIRKGEVNPMLLPKREDWQEWVGKVLDRYDGEILYTDQQIGRLLEGLKELGILENALVIITSDHGEEFREHGQIDHGKTLYEEVLHVPFLLSWPGQIPAGSVYEELVGLIDVMPTILGFLGIEPPTGIQGVSFATYLTRQSDTKLEKKFFGQLINDRLTLEMVRHRHYKLIRHLSGPQQDLDEFYDLEQDPLERINLAQQAQAQVATWRQELDTFNVGVNQVASLVPKEEIEELDKDTEKALRALGYIK